MAELGFSLSCVLSIGSPSPSPLCVFPLSFSSSACPALREEGESGATYATHSFKQNNVSGNWQAQLASDADDAPPPPVRL